ncbi:hypothetical protein EV401DRAFT_1933704, partial [Pisolithus croceorrhizus]
LSLLRYANLCVCLTSTICTVKLIHSVDEPHAVWLGTFSTFISLPWPLLMKDFSRRVWSPTLYWPRVHAVTWCTAKSSSFASVMLLALQLSAGLVSVAVWCILAGNALKLSSRHKRMFSEFSCVVEETHRNLVVPRRARRMA